MTVETPLVELRIYTVKDGERPEFDERARQVTFPIFRELGFRVERYWADVDDPHTVYYLVRWTSREEMEQQWAAFQSHPLWTGMLTAEGFVSVMAGARGIVLEPASELILDAV